MLNNKILLDKYKKFQQQNKARRMNLIDQPHTKLYSFIRMVT